MIRVVNKKNYIQSQDYIDIYIGRGSPLGNPFPIKAGWSRNRVCDEYKKYFYENIAVADSSLRKEVIRIYRLAKSGKNINLVCFCSPSRCHGDTVVEFLVKYLSVEYMSDQGGGDSLF